MFPGIPGCAKSALCKEILSSTGGLGDDRPVHSLMGDLVKGIQGFVSDFYICAQQIFFSFLSSSCDDAHNQHSYSF